MAGVVWALAEAAVNNITSAKTVLLERWARGLRWLSIFFSSKVGRYTKRDRFIKNYRPLCVPIWPVTLTMREAVSQLVSVWKVLFQSKEKVWF